MVRQRRLHRSPRIHIRRSGEHLHATSHQRLSAVSTLPHRLPEVRHMPRFPAAAGLTGTERRCQARLSSAEAG